MCDARLRPFRVPLAAFGVMSAVQAASAAALFARKPGLSGSRVQAFYLGSEASFSSPRTLPGLLEVAVPHLLAVPLFLFVALHLVGIAGVLRPGPFRALCAASFGSALAGIAAGFAVRFVSPLFAWFKLAAFGVLEMCLLTVFVLLVRCTVGRSRASRG